MPIRSPSAEPAGLFRLGIRRAFALTSSFCPLQSSVIRPVYGRGRAMFAKVASVGVLGIDAYPVESVDDWAVVGELALDGGGLEAEKTVTRTLGGGEL